MNAKYSKAVMDLFNYDGSEREERIEAMLEREGVTVEGVVATVNEMLWENDVEGAAIGVAAAMLAYPDHEASEYQETVSRILDSRCLLLKLQREQEFPEKWESKAEELISIIFDAAERIAAGHSLEF